MASFMDDDNLDLDLEVDSQAVAAAMASRGSPAGKDLTNVLPKLARRISSKSPQTRHPSENGSPSVAFSSTPDKSPSKISEPPSSRRRNTRKSVRGSLVFKLDTALPPEIAELRGRDIEPDEDSAAFRALSKAAAMAQSNDDGVVPPPAVDEMIFAERRIVEGREIQQGHDQYALTYGMMMGIRSTTGRGDLNRSSSLSKINSMAEHELSEQDYEFNLELSFPPGGASSPFPTPPHKLPFTFTFKDYMTNVFRAVRALSNIDEADYMLSLAGDFNYIEFIANSKSGQFFFYSHDGRYMIKTQTREECRLLKSIMPQYVRHLTDHPDSLLVKFYGLHRVKMPSLRSKTYFVIMSSVFSTPLPIHVKYDLKGSTVGRRTELDAALQGAVQKDVNLQESGRKIMLGEDQIDVFYETLKADTVFLRDLNIMDYSLLVGVHEAWREKDLGKKPAVATHGARRRSSCGVVLSTRYQGTGDSIYNPQNAYNSYVAQLSSAYNHTFHVTSGAVSIFQSCCGGIRSAPQAQEIYFLGIIDILQLYTSSKKMETFLKGFSHDRKQVSCVEPAWYAERMLRFVIAHTDYAAIMQARKAQAKKALHGGGSSASSAGVRTASAAPDEAEAEAAPSPRYKRASSSGTSQATQSSAGSTAERGAGRPGSSPSHVPPRRAASSRDRSAYDML